MSLLARIRATVRYHLAKRMGLPEIPTALERLKLLGFTPRIIFDAGAYHGDFARSCLRLWPESVVACFEAQHNAVQQLLKFATLQPAVRVHQTLLGASEEEAVLFHEAETASSVLTERAGPQHALVTHNMTTLDRVVDTHYHGESPNLLKLDVQGYELEVLKGAVNSLDSIAVILAEVNLLDIHAEVPLLGEVVDWLGAHGFVAYDICGLTRRPLDGALWQADFVFVRAGSEFRRDKRWQA